MENKKRFFAVDDLSFAIFKLLKLKKVIMKFITWFRNPLLIDLKNYIKS